MKTYDDVNFQSAQSELQGAVNDYIAKHAGNFFKNHTFFAFWKKPGIQRAKDMLPLISAATDLKGLLAIVKQEQGQGETLITALQAKLFGLFEVKDNDINEEAEKFQQPAKTMQSSGMRGPPVFIPAKEVDHPEVQQKAKKAILDQLLALQAGQSYVYASQPAQALKP